MNLGGLLSGAFHGIQAATPVAGQLQQQQLRQMQIQQAIQKMQQMAQQNQGPAAPAMSPVPGQPGGAAPGMMTPSASPGVVAPIHAPISSAPAPAMPKLTAPEATNAAVEKQRSILTGLLNAGQGPGNPKYDAAKKQYLTLKQSHDAAKALDSAPTSPQPQDEDLAYLKAHPEAKNQFDSHFGQGAAAKILGS